MSNISTKTKRPHRSGAVSDAINETVVRAVVDDFYAAARQDPMLGPVFDAHIADWTPHLEKMYGFWLTVLTGERRYAGNPFVKHQAVLEMSGDHFERWLDLFAGIVRRHCSPEDSAAWESSARRMGFAMSYRLGFGERPALLECHSKLETGALNAPYTPA